MGAYVYATSPKMRAKARVLRPDTTVETVDVALYTYRYKPTWSDERLNARWHFRSGAAACDSAYARSALAVPELGVCVNGDAKQLYALSGPNGSRGAFLTRGHSSGTDDHTFASQGAEILEWLELPKGWTVAKAQPVSA